MYINATPNASGAYSAPNSRPFTGSIILPDDMVSEFIRYNGFVVVTTEESVVTAIQPNTEAWEHWKATRPDPVKQLRENKTADLSATCQQTIYDGLDIELSDGTTEHYDYKALDQTNIKSMFDGVTNLGITEFPYQSEDGSCRVYSAADIVTIYTSLEGLRISQLTYYHQLKEYVATLATAEEIEAVTYGQPLTGDYLTHYNDMVAVAMEQMQQAIQRRVTANG